MGDFFGFVSHHVFASILGALGMIFSALGFAEQANAIVTKYKAWQLQALGAALFFIAVITVLVSYDSDRGALPIAAPPGPAASIAAPVNPDPTVLPSGVAAQYVDMMSRGRTDLQVQRFLSRHDGKSLDLSLKLASLSIRETGLKGQFYAGSNPNVFVTFLPEWADHLEGKNAGDTVTFRAKILHETGTGYWLGEARPL